MDLSPGTLNAGPSALRPVDLTQRRAMSFDLGEHPLRLGTDPLIGRSLDTMSGTGFKKCQTGHVQGRKADQSGAGADLMDIGPRTGGIVRCRAFSHQPIAEFVEPAHSLRRPHKIQEFSKGIRVEQAPIDRRPTAICLILKALRMLPVGFFVPAHRICPGLPVSDLASGQIVSAKGRDKRHTTERFA